MPARYIPLGEAAHEAERQAIRFVVDGLSSDYTVYSNAWLVEPSGTIYELDLVVAAPHAIYVVEVKSYRGRVSGGDLDWFLADGDVVRSPLRLNRKTAQMLVSALRRRSALAGQVWVEGLVFLSHALESTIRGPASQDRVHTRKTLLDALRDAEGLYRRTSRSRTAPVDEHARGELERLLRGADARSRPVRSIREYEIQSTVERQERFVEHLVLHRVTRARRLLRVYTLPRDIDQAAHARVLERCRWEARVLASVGDHEGILRADPAFEDEAGFCLPFEYFTGLSLTSWIAKYRTSPALQGPKGLAARVAVWRKIVAAIAHAHQQGVIHRLLRPEVILVEDRAEDPAVRVTGFELAKQVNLGKTIAASTLADERLRLAAPELEAGLSNADARSDQFGLGALLGLLLAGWPLFENTAELKRRGYIGVSSINHWIPKTLDGAVGKMLSFRASDRYATLDEAVAAVEGAITQRTLPMPVEPEAPLDLDQLPKGSRFGTDYEIGDLLGAGGLATVYAARHLVSGTTRALKIARHTDAAEQALRDEHDALKTIDCPSIVRVIDLTRPVQGRLTLVMERVRGMTLARFLESVPEPDPRTLRRYAEDLLGALAYLERRPTMHKDIKPDNLIVGEDGLTLIDFSLAGRADDDVLVGTALYRDPMLERWSPAADRYAAALCLFELYEARHAFDGQAPSPGDPPHIADGDLGSPALVAFFRRALDPIPGRRFPSAVAMRAALLEAIGGAPAEAGPGAGAGPQADGSPPPRSLGDPSTPLALTSLSMRSATLLRRAGVLTQGDLVRLEPEALRALRGFGHRHRDEVLALRAALVAGGINASDDSAPARRPIWPTLVGDTGDVHALGLPPSIADALARAGLVTVGRIADSTHEELLRLPGIADGRLRQVREALDAYAQRSEGADGPPASLDGLWARAARPLKNHQEPILAALFGVRGAPQAQDAIAKALGISQAEVSRQKNHGLDMLDRQVLVDLIERLEAHLDAAGGIITIDEAAQALEERWPVAGDVRPTGLARLTVALSGARMHRVDELDDDQSVEVVARPRFDVASLKLLIDTTRRLTLWPPLDAEAARRSLRPLLPVYERDLLDLVERLLKDVRRTGDDRGELYQTPADARPAIEHVLRRARLPVTFAELEAAVKQTFRGFAVWPEPGHLGALIAGLHEFRVEGDRIVAAPAGGVVAGRADADPLPPELYAEAPPEVTVGRILRDVARDRGYRLLVTPPEAHPEIGRSVARALGAGALFVSLEEELLVRMEPDFAAFERSERFKAQRVRLTRAVEGLLDDLLGHHGRPGAQVVLGDTGILGVCGATHLVRRLYDETQGGRRGFWALVIPGIVRLQQPYFNETTPVFQVPGTLLPLPREIPAEATGAGPGAASGAGVGAGG